MLVNSFVKRGSVLAGLVLTALASGASAQVVNFQGSTTGAFNGGAQSTSATTQHLTFNFGTFNASSSAAGFLALSSGQIGTFTLAGLPATTNESYDGTTFALVTTFTAPPGTSPASTTFNSTITGSITGTTNGGIFINFDNTPKVFTYTGGSFTYFVNDLSVNNGAGPQAISGVFQVNAIPEPGTIALLGSGLLSMVAAGGVRRKRAS